MWMIENIFFFVLFHSWSVSMTANALPCIVHIVWIAGVAHFRIHSILQ